MKIGYTVLHEDGSEENGAFTFPEEVWKGVRQLWTLVDAENYPEHVNVFWKGKYTDMFVNEIGMILKLPVNKKATEIYRNNVVYHEKITDPLIINGMPKIYGPAILLSEKVWR